MRLLKIKDVMDKTGLGRTSIYKYIGLDQFPRPVPLGEKRVAWVEHEIEEWIMTKVQQRDVSATA